MTRIGRLAPSHLTRIVATAALILYLVGSCVALIGRMPDEFHRFGSLGVAAAILFFTDRLMQIELTRQRTVERILHEYGLELEVMKGGIAPQDLPGKGFLADYIEEEVRFDILRDKATRINSRNIVLLTVATLQWGFGDLALAWLTAH